MKDQLTTRFQHNDMAYLSWYDRQCELSEDEQGNAIEFECDTVFARTVLGKEYIDWINEELKTNIKFESMYFPREYNFEEDQINVTFSKEDFSKLIAWANSESENNAKLDELLDEYTTTRSGYIAFHNKGSLQANKELYMGVILQAYSDLNSEEFDDYFDRKCTYDRMFKEV